MLRIEPAGLHDLAGAYHVCLLTGDAGRDATALYRDPDLLGHVYVGAYLARGIDTQLVAIDEGGVAGYLLSAADTGDFEDWAEASWWPRLRARYPMTDADRPDDRLIRLIHAPPRTPPSLLPDYPAHLHIDLLERTRGSGLGRRLVEHLLDELRDREVGGVHLGVDARNDNAIGFYEHLGFVSLERKQWGYVMGLRLD